MENSARELFLDELENGLPGISKAWGKFLGEASSFCLTLKNHESGVEMKIKGDAETIFRVFWNIEITKQTRRAWNDTQELTEYGAAGITILLIQELTEFTVIKRARKGEGVDYWLGYKSDKPPFRNKARLEVSGILEGDELKIKARLKRKTEQAKRVKSKLPTYIAVIEFSKPVSYLEQK